MDYIPVYIRFMQEVNRAEHSSRLFRFWLYTISEAQINEVKRKGLEQRRFPELFPNLSQPHFKHAWPDIRMWCDEVILYRNEGTILVNETLCSPIDDPSYAKILLDAENSEEVWRYVDSAHLEKALNFFNKINDEWLPYWDPKIAALCKNIIAERALLGV